MITIEQLTERINERGVKVDVPALDKEIYRIQQVLSEIESYLIKKVSVVLSIPESKVKLNSSKLMVEFFYGYHQIPVLTLTKKGKTPSLDSDTLVPFANSIPDVKWYIDYRSLSKKLNLLKNLKKEVVFGDEIHTNFNCNGALSGRFTSTAPNLQQIPAEYRKLFIPRKGFMFLCCDIHQAEPALSYQLAGVPVPEDVHENTAKELGISRDKAKVFNNGVSYGMTEFGIAKLCNCSKTEAKRYLSIWKTRNKELVVYTEKICLDAARTGKVSIYDGSLTVTDDFRSALENGYQSNRAFNIHVQGSLAKLVKIAMLNIQNYLDAYSPNSHIVLTEHDELVIELSENSLNLVPDIVSMLEHIDGFNFKVKQSLNKFWEK